MTTQRMQERQAIRRALERENIFAARVRHGRGTAWGFITVQLAEGTSDETIRRVEEIVAGATDRPFPSDNNHIGVYA